MRPLIFPLFLSLWLFGCTPELHRTFDVVVIGGGTGGTAAGIQAARMDAATLIVEPSPWLGGMLTAAGVSAVDGNHQLPGGIWGEFRARIWHHYGGPDSVATGWVSHTLFEPSVGAQVFREMAEAESRLELWMESRLLKLEKTEGGWTLEIAHQGKKEKVHCNILIDGTDLGDVAALAGVPYDLGMDARSTTGESVAPEQANDLIQDLTYAAILQDYGSGADKTIPRPANYDPAEFECACQEYCPDGEAHPCATMLSYGQLPKGKYMINWPIKGNDYYANVVEKEEAMRRQAFDAAKAKTLRFVYFIQSELGFKHLGLAEDEYPTPDRLPFLPYHREGRRIQGLSRLKLFHVLTPYESEQPLYRTGIAVGDYPIDHHHKERPDAPEIDFPPVPSFSVPLGTLIPAKVDRLLVADKAISVSNIVNGATRLQPVILQLGQAAGALAALSVKTDQAPADVSVRQVQAALLEANAYLLPFIDAGPDSPYYPAAQKVAVTGILKGRGVPYQWANQGWLDVDSTVMVTAFFNGLHELWPDMQWPMPAQAVLSVQDAFHFCHLLAQHTARDFPAESDYPGLWAGWGLSDWQPERPILKGELAVLLDRTIDPFSVEVDMLGRID